MSSVAPQHIKSPYFSGQGIPCPVHVFFQDNKIYLKPSEELLLTINSSKKEPILNWFSNYLNAEHTTFPLSLDRFTPFQRSVYQILEAIPFGETRTYKEVAELLGDPKKARAVGTACHNNPYPFLIPCHRVTQTGGGLGGFAYGLDMKEALLTFETHHRAALAGTR